jgi:hypothetical protein
VVDVRKGTAFWVSEGEFARSVMMAREVGEPTSEVGERSLA